MMREKTIDLENSEILKNTFILILRNYLITIKTR